MLIFATQLKIRIHADFKLWGFFAKKLHAKAVETAASVPPKAIRIHADFKLWGFSAKKLHAKAVETAASVPPKAIRIY